MRLGCMGACWAARRGAAAKPRGMVTDEQVRSLVSKREQARCVGRDGGVAAEGRFAGTQELDGAVA